MNKTDKAPTPGIPEGGWGKKDSKEVKINKQTVDRDSAIKKIESCDKRVSVC